MIRIDITTKSGKSYTFDCLNSFSSFLDALCTEGKDWLCFTRKGGSYVVLPKSEILVIVITE